MKRIVMTAALAVVAAAPAPPVQSLAGRYSRHFPNALVDGTEYESDDVVEIVPVDARHAYFRASLQFYNGHQCSLSGIARIAGHSLIYAEKSSDFGQKCRLTIAARGKALLLDDNGGTCSAYCGARGSFSHQDGLTLSSRRPIGYMARLKGSTEYRSAIAEWKAGKVE